MVAHHGSSNGLPKTGMTLYRPGEIVVLVERAVLAADRTARTKTDRNTVQRALAGFFREIGSPLRADTFRVARDREPLRLQRRGGDGEQEEALFLQTVTLASTPRQHRHEPPDDLVPSMVDVVRVVDAVNRRDYSPAAQKSLDDAGLRIVAVTPNWLATAFCF